MPAQPEAIAREHELSLCPRDAAGDLAAFLHEHWKTNHVLARSPSLLDWQHLHAQADRYNFVIARNAAAEIDGILGFIPTSQFDAALTAGGDLWLAIWKVRPSAGALGLALLGYLTRTLNPRSVSAIGLSAGVIPIYKCLGFKVGKLDHYYLVNRSKTKFSVLGGFDGIYDGIDAPSPACALEPCLHVPDELFSDQRLPAKSAQYARRRYQDHPIYKYDLRSIRRGALTLGVIVVRKVSHGQAHALRTVDFFGPPDALRGCAGAFQSLLREYDAEYVDFYSHGITPPGFIRRGEQSGVIVPNYFEPFERRNVELDFAYKIYGSSSGQFVLVKGDSDQDRPSRLGDAS